MNAIIPVLLGRCEAILRTKIPDSEPGAGEMREEVLDRFTEVLARGCVDERSDELDFYECRFNQSLRALRIDVVKHKRVRLLPTVEIARAGDGDGLPLSLEDGLALLSEAGRTRPTQEQSALLEEVKEAIEALPADEREAFVLCRVYGYKVESKDPDEITAAVLCKCTGRTIRNRLSRADAKLWRLKEES
ncbi:MAG: hypothetical protein OXI76_16580 [Gemmatimonadota bacterium]|nr:hypothetical protein [Gemmatimonadota bacterium]